MRLHKTALLSGEALSELETIKSKEDGLIFVVGFLDWLGLRKRKKNAQALAQLQEQVQKEPELEPAPETTRKPKQIEIPFKEIRTRLTDDELANMPEREKMNHILKIVTDILDELAPPDENGERTSRLSLLLEQFNKGERAMVRKMLDQLDVDEMILRHLKHPLLIEDVAQRINKTYGYTASRLRVLRRTGKVTRYRDHDTNKYRYTRVRDVGRTLGLEQMEVTSRESEHAESSLLIVEEAEAAQLPEGPASSESGKKERTGRPTLELDTIQSPQEPPEKKKEDTGSNDAAGNEDAGLVLRTL